jgi:hypothetical protein
MGEDKTATQEIAQGLKSLFERIAEFFDIFDLSFFVAGATTAAALAFWAWRAGIDRPSMRDWTLVLSVIIACYVLGLMCFALGRWCRVSARWKKSQREFSHLFSLVMRGHGLSATPIVYQYLAREQERGDWRLYVRLWSELRHRPNLVNSCSLLKRYWVMAATYDGLAVALCVWAIVLCLCAFGLGGAIELNKYLAIPAASVMILCAIACSHEASRYFQYQVEELVGSIVALIESGEIHGVQTSC